LILVNVKYDGQNYFYQTECPDDMPIFTCSLPPAIDLNGKTFPNGENRLVQVLLVYENTDGEMAFFYDDKQLSFGGGVQSVNIGSAGWIQNDSQGEGELGGRLFRSGAPATNLTGVVGGFYQPPNGSPPMMVTEEFVFGGWFEFMFLKNVPFTYKHLATGEVLFFNKRFEDLVALKDASGPDSQAIHIKIPKHYSYFYNRQLIDIPTMEFHLLNSPDYTLQGSLLGDYGLAANDPISELDTITEWRGILMSGPDGNDTRIASGSSASGILQVKFDGLGATKFHIDDVILQMTNTDGATSFSIDVEDENTNIIATRTIFSMTPWTQQSFSGSIYNPTNFINIELPGDIDGDFQLSNIEIYARLIETELQLDEEFIYGMYDLDTASFLPGNNSGTGVGWYAGTLPIANTFDDSTAFINNSGSISNYESLEEMDYNSGLNCSGSDFDICFPNRTSRQPTNNAACGSSMTANCFNTDPSYLQSTGTLLPFSGPFSLQPSGEVAYVSSCSGSCSVTTSLVPGLNPAEWGIALFFIPGGSDAYRDFVPCGLWEEMSAIKRDYLSFGAEFTSNILESDFYNGEVYACPYKIDAGERKYFGFAEKVYYNGP
tara:strand:+ start:1742 stop:3550 length:1809 start_codon:yes stop_codon:yes gene_type:complete